MFFTDYLQIKFLSFMDLEKLIIFNRMEIYMDSVIVVKSLKKSFGSVKAVKGIDFTVKKGSLFAFLGTNGAGKSTTIDILCTLNSFDEGEVNIVGYDVKKNSNDIKKRIGIVFQDGLMDKKLTVRENLMIRAGFYHKTNKARKKAVLNAAKYTEIDDFIDRNYGVLSGGQRRRVDIARALLNTPEILFLDEPTTGLDPQTRKHIWETVEKLQKENNMTIFLTTHYMEEASKADYVVIIDNGFLVAQGTPLELKERYCFDHIAIQPKKSNDIRFIEEYLNKEKLIWKNKSDVIDIRIKSTIDSISILSPILEYIENFEVLHGTMDDVFLNITGKEIKE